MPASLELSPLFDPTLDRVGFPLDHPYIERVYCSVLGPSSVLFLRRAGDLFAEHPQGTTVDLVDLARSLGLRSRADTDDIGKNSPLRRTMERLVRFGMAAWRGDNHLGVHPKLPALERHRAARLPEPVQAVHHRLLTDHLDGLVARAEGRELNAPSVEDPGPERLTAPVERRESPVATRLRAFGTNGDHPRIVTR